MSNPKFKIGDVVKIWDEEYQYFMDGYIVLIMNALSDDRDYYCSIYPGAISNYEYVYCVDPIYRDSEDSDSLQALNKFKENQIKLADIKIERKRKLNIIENGRVL